MGRLAAEPVRSWPGLLSTITPAGISYKFAKLLELSALLFLLESVKKSAVGEMGYDRPYLRGANRLSDDPS